MIVYNTQTSTMPTQIIPQDPQVAGSPAPGFHALPQPFAAYVTPPPSPMPFQLCAPQLQPHLNSFPMIYPIPTQGVFLSPGPLPTSTPPAQIANVFTSGNNNFAISRQAHPLMQDQQIPIQKNSQLINNQNQNVMNNMQTPQWKADPSQLPVKYIPNNYDPQFNFQQGMHPRNSNYNGFVGMRNGHKAMSRGRNFAPHFSGYSNVPRKAKKKFGFRSKQNMIDKVYLALVEQYERRGILAGDDEVLRGEDTIRLHVKKFKALQRIEEALQAAERMDSVTIARVSIPLSMKNQFQKKGFLVYVQVEKVWMVPLAQKIFRQFDEFKKCDVARHTTEATTEEKEAPAAAAVTFKEPTPVVKFEEASADAKKEEDIDDDFDGLFTGPMVPQRSCGEMGQ